MESQAPQTPATVAAPVPTPTTRVTPARVLAGLAGALLMVPGGFCIAWAVVGLVGSLFVVAKNPQVFALLGLACLVLGIPLCIAAVKLLRFGLRGRWR